MRVKRAFSNTTYNDTPTTATMNSSPVLAVPVTTADIPGVMGTAHMWRSRSPLAQIPHNKPRPVIAKKPRGRPRKQTRCPPRTFSRITAKSFYASYKMIAIPYEEIATRFAQYPHHRSCIERLARNKGWADFTIEQDVIANGIHTRPHVLLGLDLNHSPPTVETFATLECGGKVHYMGKRISQWGGGELVHGPQDAVQRPQSAGCVKMGNLLSSGGMCGPGARKMIQYAHYVVKKDGLDTLVLVDIEKKNKVSRHCYKAEGYVEWDPRRVRRFNIDLPGEDKWEPYDAPTDEPCVLVAKRLSGTAA